MYYGITTVSVDTLDLVSFLRFKNISYLISRSTKLKSYIIYPSLDVNDIYHE